MREPAFSFVRSMFTRSSKAQRASNTYQSNAAVPATNETKKLLTRREIQAEYGWSEKKTGSMEKAGYLTPIRLPATQAVNVRKKTTKLYGVVRRYLRSDIQALLLQLKEEEQDWSTALNGGVEIQSENHDRKLQHSGAIAKGGK